LLRQRSLMGNQRKIPSQEINKKAPALLPRPSFVRQAG
jgi:hypothetical protein